MSTQLDMTIRVNVELSENTQKFLRELFCSFNFQNKNPESLPTSEEVKPQEQNQQPAKRKRAKTPEIAETPKSDAEKAPTPESQNTASPSDAADSVTIKDLREELMKKVDAHREAIKDKLSELGSPSITKLDEKYYSEFYEFLKSL